MPAQADEIIGTASGKVYHTQHDCLAATKIPADGRVIFKSVAEAQAQGRRLCRICERLAGKASPPPDRPVKNPKQAEHPPPLPPVTSNPSESEKLADSVQLVRVKKVLAGGTFLLDTGEKITILGVCIPQAGQEQAEEAVSFIQERIRGHKMKFSAIKADDGSPLRDALGRLPGTARADDRKPEFADELLQSGMAWVDREVRSARFAEYLSFETEAWQKGRGIWKRLDGDAGQVEVITGRYAAQYHRSNCPHVAHLTESSPLTLNEAKARRLTPCENFRTAAASVRGKSSFKDPSNAHDAKDKKE